jgi:ParB-like chromosome segregation protein Spo0J
MQEVEYLTVPIDDLRKNSFNSNKVSALNEEKIRTSIERNGLFKPIIVRTIPGEKGYEIIGGEHRWEQAMELGYETVPIANLGPISDVKAKEISVIDNARYGADDTLMFADILKDIGTIDDISHFLPYGDADLSAIFAASNISLDELETDTEDLEIDVEPAEKTKKPEKTHTIMRFKVPLGDAERVTALIIQTQKTHGYTTSDELTNAGDALVHLLSDHIRAPSTPSNDLEEFSNMLDAIASEKDEAK